MKKNILFWMMFVIIILLLIIIIVLFKSQYYDKSNKNLFGNINNNEYIDDSEEKYFTDNDIKILKENKSNVPIITEKQRIFYGMIENKNVNRCGELSNGNKNIEKECSEIAYYEILKRTKDKSYCSKINIEKQKTSILCQNL